jgi:hypothetical protein
MILPVTTLPHGTGALPAAGLFRSREEGAMKSYHADLGAGIDGIVLRERERPTRVEPRERLGRNLCVVDDRI